MAFSIIMLACLIVCVGIDYLSLKHIDQNGALLGVTLPPDAAALPEVQSIVQQYLRWLRIICLLCAAGGVVFVGLPVLSNSPSSFSAFTSEPFSIAANITSVRRLVSFVFLRITSHTTSTGRTTHTPNGIRMSSKNCSEYMFLLFLEFYVSFS